MAASSQADVAARLIERLLADPAFRARFRRDPAGACREAGLDELAQEMSVAGGKAMMTLDIRESKSSLAGVMMAAAMEGAAIYQFTENLLPHLDEIPGQIADVLSRVDLPAIPDALKKSPSGGDAAPAAAVAPAEAPAEVTAPPAAPPPAAPPPPPEADAKAAEKAAEAKADAPPPPPEEAKPDKAEAAAEEAAAKIAEEDSPEAASKAAQEEAAAALDEQTTGLPESSDLPTGTADGAALPETPPENALPEAPPANALPEAPPANALPEAPPANALPTEAPPDAAAPAPVAAVAEVPEVKRAAIDPAQFGGEEVGTGGAPDPEALALLNNKKVVLDDVGIADIKAGRIDPRVVAVLTKLSQEHEIKVSCMCSDHSKMTAGGSISNHFYGRGLDIAAIDGEIVNPGSTIAREVASELSSLDPNYRPNEIGSPWAIGGPGYFTDAAHQDHLHIGFKEQITADWKPSADVAARGYARGGRRSGRRVVAPVAGAPVVAPVAGAPSRRWRPRRPRSRSRNCS